MPSHSLALMAKKYAWFNKETGLHLFDFDRASGALSNYRSLTIEQQPSIGGLCFHPIVAFYMCLTSPVLIKLIYGKQI